MEKNTVTKDIYYQISKLNAKMEECESILNEYYVSVMNKPQNISETSSNKEKSVEDKNIVRNFRKITSRQKIIEEIIKRRNIKEKEVDLYVESMILQNTKVNVLCASIHEGLYKLIRSIFISSSETFHITGKIKVGRLFFYRRETGRYCVIKGVVDNAIKDKIAFTIIQLVIRLFNVHYFCGGTRQTIDKNMAHKLTIPIYSYNDSLKNFITLVYKDITSLVNFASIFSLFRDELIYLLGDALKCSFGDVNNIRKNKFISYYLVRTGNNNNSLIEKSEIEGLRLEQQLRNEYSIDNPWELVYHPEMKCKDCCCRVVSSFDHEEYSKFVKTINI